MPPLYVGWDAVNGANPIFTAPSARLSEVILHERVHHDKCSIGVMTSCFYRSKLGNAQKMEDHLHGHLTSFELDPRTFQIQYLDSCILKSFLFNRYVEYFVEIIFATHCRCRKCSYNPG
jgi:hypothetical protein